MGVPLYVHCSIQRMNNHVVVCGNAYMQMSICGKEWVCVRACVRALGMRACVRVLYIVEHIPISYFENQLLLLE